MISVSPFRRANPTQPSQASEQFLSPPTLLTTSRPRGLREVSECHLLREPYRRTYRTSTSTGRDSNARSKVTSFSPAAEANATRYASAHTLGHALPSREWTRRRGSRPSGSEVGRGAGGG